MHIIPYKQTLSHSCLTACFLMLLQEKKAISFDETLEEALTMKGSKRIYPFYVVGIAKEVFNHFKVTIEIIVDNKYYTKILNQAFMNDEHFLIHHQRITIALIKKILKEKSIICYIDNNLLGDYSHSPHFIIIEKVTKKKIAIIDPLTGKRNYWSDKKLADAIYSLKRNVKMCPLLYSLN